MLCYLNNTSPPQSTLITFLEKAINPWDRKQLNLLHKQEEGICIALPNLLAVPRVIIVVLMSHIIGILLRKIHLLPYRLGVARPFLMFKALFLTLP